MPEAHSYAETAMKREELARTLAQRTGLTKLEARDEVDQLVHKILNQLRQGRQVKLPGVGKLAPAKRPR